jgi:uncharacterized protein (TIGR02646 family)
LKKINKSSPPNKLTEYAQQNPQASWNEFYDVNQSNDYKTIKELIFKEQGGLCAFCENEVIGTHKQQLEHFHPKADKTNPNHNWALDWKNIIGVCSGGKYVDKTVYPLPANLSCDAYKDHLITKGKLAESCEGYLLNPLELLAFPCLFDFNKRTGELIPNDDYAGIEFENNQYGKTSEFIEKTIEYLNLNCDRLNKDRIAVFHEYERLLKKARADKKSPNDFLDKLAKHWFQKQWLPFFTTRRILLGNHAENYLTNVNYSG